MEACNKDYYYYYHKEDASEAITICIELFVLPEF